MVYVGQSSDLSKRITQHIVGKDWWESVVILTTKDDGFNHADIDYLESVLIDKAQKINRLECDNRNKGNQPKVTKYQKVNLDQYLDEALFLMQLIGITVFTDKKTNPLFNTIDMKTKLSLGKRTKSEAISFLALNGIPIGKNPTYAALQAKTGKFWANPKINLLNEDWEIILNNNELMELIVMRIPAKSLKIQSGNNIGLHVRQDKADMIDLNIDAKTFIDRTSKIDFSSFICKKIKY